MRFFEPYQKTLLSIFVCFLLAQCSKTSTPEQLEQPAYTFILAEIPPHIQEVENLTVFPGDSEPTHTIELIEQQIYGNDVESNFYFIYKCSEDDMGRLIVWGRDSNRGDGVFVYNADGTYYTQLGGQGKGPGEYGIIMNVDAKAGKVFVSDYTSLRLNEYSTQDYSIERSIKFEQWNVVDELEFKNYVIPRNDGNYILAFTDKTQRLGQIELIYKIMDNEGNSVSDNTLVFPAGFTIDTRSESQIPKPSLPLEFMGNTSTALSKDDAFYAASTNDFLIKKYDVGGGYQSAFYYPVEGSPFDLDEYLKTAGSFTPKAHQIRSAFDKMNVELPKTYPIIEKMMVDDENRIWVAIPSGTERENYEWWILKESGELLAKLLLPRNQRIFDIKNGYLYGRKDNGKKLGYLYRGAGSDDEDAEYIVKYRIELSKNKRI